MMDEHDRRLRQIRPTPSQQDDGPVEVDSSAFLPNRLRRRSLNLHPRRLPSNRRSRPGCQNEVFSC